MKRTILTFTLAALALVSPLAFGQTSGGVATVPGQVYSTQLNPATAVTSEAGAVTNPSSNFIINVTGGPVICPAGDLQYMNSSQLTLNASTTYLLVWNCLNEQLYVKTGVTGPGSPSTSSGTYQNYPGTPTNLLFADWNRGELALNTIVCGSTNCGNTSNGTLTDQRSASNFPIVTDWTEFVPAVGACSSTVSGNSTGTNGNTVVGASSISVVQAQTSVTGTNTHTYNCHIPLPTKLTAGKGVVAVNDVTWFYGVQTTNLGTQSTADWTAGSITLPAAGASETPSTVTPVALGGTITLTPLVASFNTATTTAGAFYSEKIGFGTPFALNTDLYDPNFTITLVLAATSAQITNTPGFNVHYAFIPF